jgi:hypothetical protein
MPSNIVTIKTATLNGFLLGTGQPAMAIGYASDFFYVSSASALSRIDITVSQVLTGNIRVYGRKYQ